MKKIFPFIFLGLSTLLLTVSCGGKNNSNDEPIEVNTKRIKSDDEGGFTMAYYNLDSIATQFHFYVEIDSILKAKETQFTKELEKKYIAYQNYEAEIQRRLENNEITGFELEGIQETAYQKQQAIAEFEQTKGYELQKESIQYQTALMNKISQAGKEFSEEHGIDVLFFYQTGGQITYIKEDMDVTDAFIKYLNKREKDLKDGFEKELEELEESAEKELKNKGGLK